MTRPAWSRVSIIYLYLSICRGCKTGDSVCIWPSAGYYFSLQESKCLLCTELLKYIDVMRIAAIAHLFLCFVMGKDKNSPEIKFRVFFCFCFCFSSLVVITDYIPSGKKNIINVEKSHVRVCTYVLDLFQPFSPWLTWPAQLWPGSWKQLSMKYPWLKC